MTALNIQRQSTLQVLGQITDRRLKEENTVTAEKIKGYVKDSEVQEKAKIGEEEKKRHLKKDAKYGRNGEKNKK